MDAFGPTLDRFCKNQGVTLKELSQQLGVSWNTMTNWKANGKPPRREDTKKLAKMLYLNEEETDLLLTSAGYAPEYRTRGTGNLHSSSSDSIKVEEMIVQRLLLSEVSDQKLASSPRVFISYARSDGEEFADTLRTRLEVEGIPLWQDRVGMEGGHDWWLQIVEALNKVEFMILVMTPAALQSPIVQKEWRYARQQGVCVYPVKGHPNLDFASLPRWMRDAHWYDIDYEWTKFINDLNTRCQEPRRPFMVEDLPSDFVQRPNEFEELINMLLDEKRENPIAITAALHGAGGYGKTTIAKALCHDERIQEVFDDGILWVTLGEKPDNIIGMIENLIYYLVKERPGFTSIDTARAYFADLLADRDILLVIDDVWNLAHLRPFLQGGKRCARLITTRNNEVLPVNSQCIQVDKMHEDEAVRLLSTGVSNIISKADERRELSKLSETMGNWPLLLKLANGALRRRINTYHQSLSEALSYINRSLDKYGMTAFDERNPQERDQAISRTLSVSFELLSEEEYARYKELSIFPEDTAIPLATLQRLWGVTGGLDDLDTEKLCEQLYGLSLLLNFDLTTRTIRLHDVFRIFLQQEEGEKVPALHNQLLNTYGLKRWTDLPSNEVYLWTHLAYHLIGARKIDELIATVKALRYLATKAFMLGVSNVEVDLDLAKKEAPNDSQLSLLKNQIGKLSNLLSRGKTLHEVECILLSRLSYQKEISLLCQAFEQEITLPLIKTWHPFPDLDSPALIRRLQWHKSGVRSCAVSPDGKWIVSASDDGTLRLWDVQTGTERLILRGHINWVRGCAVSPAGDWIVSASDDGTLKLWDVQTGACLVTLHVDGRLSSCAFLPDGMHLIATGDKGVYFLTFVTEVRIPHL